MIAAKYDLEGNGVSQPHTLDEEKLVAPLREVYVPARASAGATIIPFRAGTRAGVG
jgi:hypothetical protein